MKKINSTTAKEFLKSRNFVAFAGFVVGIICFGVVYGYKVVNPLYDDWIYAQQRDVLQHYLGWVYYRKSEWNFPIGMMDGLLSNEKVSIIYTDSLPLFAVFFKILSPVLPKTFQYIGLWEITSFGLMGSLASLLIRKFNKNSLFCLIGSIFYIVSVPVIQRSFEHDALSGQWIIISAMLLLVYQDYKFRHKATPVILWTLLGIVTASVHLYFIPMIYLIMLAYIIVDLFKNKKIIRPVLIFVSTTIFALIILYLNGGFYGDTELKANGFGVYSANLNALINSYGYSDFLKPLGAYRKNMEGLGYLGLGMIILLVISFATSVYYSEKKNGKILKTGILAIKRYKFQIISFAIIILIGFFYALGDTIVWGTKIVCEIDYPDKLIEIFSMFRASGRFIWLVDYSVFTIVLALISKSNPKKTAIIIVALTVWIQFMDLKTWIERKHTNYATVVTDSNKLQDEKWDELAKNSTELVFWYVSDDKELRKTGYFDFAKLAVEYNLSYSSFYLARDNEEEYERYANEQFEMLENGNGRKDALYIFMKTDNIPKVDNIEVYELDGYTVAKVK
jgi:hypothetical protein